jgi:hypothetical protein
MAQWTYVLVNPHKFHGLRYDILVCYYKQIVVEAFRFFIYTDNV